MNILILSLSAGPSSVSRAAALAFAEHLKKEQTEVAFFDIRDLPAVWVDGRAITELPKPYQDLHQAAKECKGVALFFPIHCYSMSGAAKTLTEIIGGPLTRKPLAVVSAAGSPRSHLAVRDLMASMIFDKESICFPKTVQLTGDDLAEDGQFNAGARERLESLAQEFLHFTKALEPFVACYPG